VLKKELSAQLRTARRMRHPKSHNAKSGQGHILDMVSIRERPAEIEEGLSEFLCVRRFSVMRARSAL
jgi:hypothetical protein